MARIQSQIIPVIASLIAGTLLFVAFPDYEFTLLVWVGLVPLLTALRGKSILTAFLLSYLCGLVFFLGIFKWILHTPGYTYLHHMLLDIYLSIYFGIFGLVYSFISRRCGPTIGMLAAPFVWASLEYLRSNMFFLALPWGLLAHSQYKVYSIIQIASITGVYGVSFLIVLVNSALTIVALSLLARLGNIGQLPNNYLPSKTGRRLIITAAAGSLIIVFAHGKVLMARHSGDKKVKIAVVQGNIEQNKKWSPKYRTFIVQTYVKLTREVSENKPSLIVWPETATPKSITVDKNLYKLVRRVSNDAGTYLLLGSSQRQKFKDSETKKKTRIFNSAFLIPPEDDREPQHYSKIRLFPFGEYLPMKEVVPWSLIKVPEISGYESGEKFAVFEGPSFKFSTTICWENLFPDLVRQFVMAGAQFIINITNEAWFGKTTAPYQFVSMNVFRAVENQVFVVRCANTGISCFINPNGKIVKRVTDEHGNDVFVRGILTGEVVPMNSRTFYTRYGDVFGILCLISTAILLLIGFLKK